MSLDREIDALCDEFEEKLGTLDALTIEEVLPRIDEPRRPTLLTELIKIELDSLEGVDLTKRQADYEARFPENGRDVVRAYREVFGRDTEDFEREEDGRSLPLQVGESIGKYDLLALLGVGSFGAVYRSYDHEIDRAVAIKVPLEGQLASRLEEDQFLRDAKNAAQLKAPGIVSIYHSGRAKEIPYIVEEFLPGGDLKQALASKRFSFRETATLILGVAEALDIAHQRRIIHRDLKPGNILLTKEGKPCITDFGLSMREESRHLHHDEVCGAPAYMAPEQVRGESHRITAQTDLWSLGVILYEMLCGTTPFVAKTRAELAAEIKEKDPLPLHNHVREIPAELERVCMKCLAKRMSDRYSRTGDLVNDLREWLESTRQYKHTELFKLPVVIRPKGLRPFDEDDEEYFLNLLPGPRDTRGVPDSIRFWTNKITQRRNSRTFRVGLLYGPSGSGKTSYVRAGILPRLPKEVTVLHVEATGEETELRILRQLRSLFPDLSPDLDLPQALATIRDGNWMATGEKLLIIIDQFEQWLHANRALEEAQLVDGLRQCDGGNVQAMVLVRDEFWMGITRFMESLEAGLERGTNTDIVDRFSLAHSRKVLQLFGEAYGHVVPEDEESRREYNEFLDAAVQELAEDDRVVSIRLALFAEMIKDKPWHKSTLDQFGGADGIGVAFLDEAFDSARGNPAHRVHAAAARKVLEALLPDEVTEIKGHMRSLAELRKVSGYEKDDAAFTQLLNVLDRQLRLITPTDPVLGQSALGESSQSASNASSSQAAETHVHYQLTHDFLVPALRSWIHRTELETWRGRARLRMRERAQLWNARREPRQLPSLWEWSGMKLATRKRERSEVQEEMLKQAGGLRLRQAGALMLVIAAVVFGILAIRRQVRDEAALQLVVNIVESPPDQLRTHIEKLVAIYPAEGRELLLHLHRLEGEVSPDVLRQPRAQRNIEIALASLGVQHSDWLIEQAPITPLPEIPNLARALKGAEASALGKWSSTYRQNTVDENARLTYLLLLLGETTPIIEIAKDNNSVDVYSHLQVAIPNSNPDTGALADVLITASARDADQNQHELSSLCLILAGIPPEDFPAEKRAQVEDKLVSLYTTCRFADVHSASKFALEQWQIPLPPIAPQDVNKIGDKEWFVNSWGMTMLLVPDTEDSPLFVAAYETAVAQLLECIRFAKANNRLLLEDNSSPEDSPYVGCPITNISGIDALRFCNQLSEANNLTPCYVQTADSWFLNPVANGYRLLTTDEWENTCQAGSKTPYSYGSTVRYYDEFLAHGYEHFPVGGSRRPNLWGFFDFPGSVGELTMQVDANNRVRFAMSGQSMRFQDGPEVHSSDARVHFDADSNPSALFMGFRVTCQLPVANEQPRDSSE